MLHRDTIKERGYVEALSRGDSTAFEWLFLRYQPKLVYFFSGFLQDDEMGRDMAQDLFFNLWINRERLADVRSFAAYLYQMARNALHNHYDHSLVVERYEAEHAALSTVSDDLEEQLFVDELRQHINREVEQMPPQRRQIYRMSRVEGLSNQEIADQLNISKRTVENHLTAALADLRKRLKVIFLTFF